MAGEIEPKTALLRRGEVCRWLGLADHEITKLISEKVIKPRYFRDGSRAFFVKKEIEEELLNVNRPVEA
jgi:hypothetical protein